MKIARYDDCYFHCSNSTCLFYWVAVVLVVNVVGETNDVPLRLLPCPGRTTCDRSGTECGKMISDQNQETIVAILVSWSGVEEVLLYWEEM